jgi:hypothetical protein
MRILKPVVGRRGNVLRISARVELESDARAGLPDELWFEFPAEIEPHLSPVSDGFLLALMPLAMRLGEAVRVEGPVSNSLPDGLLEWQRVMQEWFPQLFEIVPLELPALVSEGPRAPGCVGSAFSGGADSFFTLFENLKAPNAEGGVLRNALFMHGFDIPLEDVRSFEIARQVYVPKLAGLGVRLVCGATNARAFVQRVGWEVSHGAVLIGTAHLLSGLWEKFLVPGSGNRKEPQPWGSDWRVDHYLSSRAVRVNTDGVHRWKMEKVLSIVRHPEVLDCLRVCWREIDGLMNCGRCAKCVRTMATLKLAGVLDQASTFKRPLDRRTVRAARFSKWEFSQVRALIDGLGKSGETALARDLRWALALSGLKEFARGVKRRLRG